MSLFPLPRANPRSGFKRIGKALDIVLETAMVGQELHVGAIDLDPALRLLLQVLLAA